LRKEAAIAEEKKAEELKKSKEAQWSKDEIALLTKAIVRFPPGSTDRWKTVADFIGTKNSKEVIAKAQEIASRREQAHKQQKDDTTA